MESGSRFLNSILAVAPSAGDLAEAQASCPDLKIMQQAANLQLATVDVEGKILYGEVSTGIFRPVVPEKFRLPIFLHLHGAVHPGVRASRRLITARYVWPNISRDVSTWAKQCLNCQRAKVQKHVHLKPDVFPVPNCRFQHIHVDLVGPLPPSGGFSHLFTIVDRTTRWLEAVPVSSTSAEACAEALFAAWISRFGVPEHITSDRGTQFASAVWAALGKRLGISLHHTTAFHPQSNGMLERIHRRLKDALKARMAGVNWLQELPWVLG